MESGSRFANMVLVSGKACKVILILESGRKELVLQCGLVTLNSSEKLQGSPTRFLTQLAFCYSQSNQNPSRVLNLFPCSSFKDISKIKLIFKNNLYRGGVCLVIGILSYMQTANNIVQMLEKVFTGAVIRNNHFPFQIIEFVIAINIYSNAKFA